ncbi:MAG: S24 family peptidase, partial [Oscillospiraceae bacterium]
IANEAIVLVRKVNELSNGDVGIFSVDGEIMCKRYCVNGADIILRPDNQSGGFSDMVFREQNVQFRGK